MNYLDPYPNEIRPVLLLHGLGADASSWTMQFDPLGNAGFRPIAVDLPGFGETKNHGEWTLLEASNQAAKLMLDQGFTKFDVVGISMGGVVAQLLAFDYLPNIRKLVLVNTFACLRPRKIGEWIYLLRRFIVANLRGVEYQAQMVAERLFPEAHQADLRKEIVHRILSSDRLVYRTAMRQLILFDSRKWLRRINCPTLVISGAMDTTVPLQNQGELAAGIPNAQQIIIEGARHAVIVDRADSFNQALLEYLEFD